MNIAEKIYGLKPTMLIFFPQYSFNKRKNGAEIEKAFENVKCINLGYKLKQLNEKTRQIQQELEYFRLCPDYMI